MNLETRQFIWGLILMVICSYGLLSFGLDLRDHLAIGITLPLLAWDLVMIALQAFGIYQGAVYILKNI